jgi:predicted kinase
MGTDSDSIELVILIGLPGSGKTSFHRERFAATHAHVSKDLMRNRRDKQAHQMRLVEAALGAGQSVVVDNVNAAGADRQPLIAVGRQYGARVIGYLLVTPAALCAERNRDRVGRERVPIVAIHAAAKRFEPPTHAEGFDELYRVAACDGGFESFLLPAVPPDGETSTIFLLSPASTSGERATLLLRDSARFPLARQLRSAAGAPLGEIFSFCSSLYFRGKLTYARAFGRPPAGLCGAFVITPGEGLRDPSEPITLARLRRYDEVRIKSSEKRYLQPLLRDANALKILAGGHCRIVLLGSIASTRYVEPLLEVFGDRLLFPSAFVGRGDMSRGGLLLRCADAGQELDYRPVLGAARHGPRPERLLPRTRPRTPPTP